MKMSKRHVNGILLLDKPLNLTSNAALQICKRLFNAAKAGHTGSLDPLATGMLPICFGDATKYSQYLLDADKIYCVDVKLGVRTTTGDAEGEVIAEKPVPVLTTENIEQTLQSFRGEILQCPPMYSALKHQGQPLYALARRGITIERASRPVTVYECRLEQYHAPVLSLYLRVSKGTYVRTIAEDIGELLGCGAHVSRLERLSVAGFAPDQRVPLSLLETADEATRDTHLLPVDTAVQSLPLLTCLAIEVTNLRYGRPIVVKDRLSSTSGEIRLYTPDAQFMGIGRVKGDIVEPLRLCSAPL